MIRLTQNTKSRIRSLYLSGQSQQAVGEALNLERTVVGYWVRKFGIQRSLSDSHLGRPNKSNTKFQPGKPSWNKGMKRWWKSHSFQKGHIPWHKGKKTGRVPRSAFKKGQPAYNRGKPAPWAQGARNVNWKGGVSGVHRTIRSSEQYQSWRRDVFVRDQFTCQQCGHRFINMVAHHLKSFADYPDLRFILTNGLTLCRSCHCKLHKPATGDREVVGVSLDYS